jgi:hypothetical protein
VTVFTQLEILHKHVTNECFKTFVKFSIDTKLGGKKRKRKERGCKALWALKIEGNKVSPSFEE